MILECARNALLAHVKHVTKKSNEVVYAHLVTNYPKVKNCAQQQIVGIIRNMICAITVIMKPKAIQSAQCVKPNILNLNLAFAKIALERNCSIARVVKLHWVLQEHAKFVEIFKSGNIRTLQSSVSISRNRKAKKSIVPRLQLLGNFARTVTS
jgi:ABC-type antimicrobial peptide transport system ATPase subunit